MTTTNVERPRLLVLASTYPRWPGDPEPGFVHELAKRLTARFDVTVLCPHSPGAATTSQMDEVAIVRYRYAPASMETLVNDGGLVSNLRRRQWKWLLVPGFFLAQLVYGWWLLVRFRPNVIHAHWLLPQGAAMAILKVVLGRFSAPLLVTSHGADLYALRKWPFRVVKRFVANRAKQLTVVSGAMVHEMAALGIDAARVEVAPMGVDLQSRFTPDPGVNRSTREILFVGRLVEKKGLRHLLDAMPAVLAAHPDAILTVAGFGPEEAERLVQAEAIGIGPKVRFLGAVPQAELPALYRRAAVFVAPFVEAASGDREGLGLVLVEATGCGCPVVVSDLPAVHDVFSPTEVSYVQPGDPIDLGRALIAMLSDPDASQRTRDLLPGLRKRFDWNAVAQRYGDLLLGIASDRTNQGQA